MNKDQVLEGLYNYLLNNLPNEAIDLIIQNDIRVENFFAIHTGVYLHNLVEQNEIHSYNFQHTILLQNPQRAHIDIAFTDNDNALTYLELKHFSISQNRGNGRRLTFYTGNTIESKKLGIVGDCEKLDNLRLEGYIPNTINLVCCAFITQKPTNVQIERMLNSFINYPELNGWEVVFPVPINNQSENFAMMTLQKNGIAQQNNLI